MRDSREELGGHARDWPPILPRSMCINNQGGPGIVALCITAIRNASIL